MKYIASTNVAVKKKRGLWTKEILHLFLEVIDGAEQQRPEWMQWRVATRRKQKLRALDLEMVVRSES